MSQTVYSGRRRRFLFPSHHHHHHHHHQKPMLNPLACHKRITTQPSQPKPDRPFYQHCHSPKPTAATTFIQRHTSVPSRNQSQPTSRNVSHGSRDLVKGLAVTHALLSVGSIASQNRHTTSPFFLTLITACLAPGRGGCLEKLPSPPLTLQAPDVSTALYGLHISPSAPACPTNTTFGREKTRQRTSSFPTGIMPGDLPSWQDKSPGRIRAESQKIAVLNYCSTVYNTPAGTQVVYR